MWIYYVLAVFVILTVVLTALMFRRAFFRPAAPDVSKTEELERSALFGYSPILKPAVEWLSGRDWTELAIEAEDGAPLYGRMLIGRKNMPAFLMLHGYASSAFSDFALSARWAVRRGCTVLLADERGHGRSGGAWTTLGALESADCRLWAEKLAELTDGRSDIVIMGVGMGGTAAVFSLTRGLPPEVRAIVSDCGYVSAKDQLEYTVKNVYHMRGFPLLPLFALFARLVWHVRLGTVETATALQENKEIPVFFAHGKEDLKVPYSEAEKAFEACASEKQLFTSENAGHSACCLAETERYYSELQSFLKKCVKWGGKI